MTERSSDIEQIVDFMIGTWGRPTHIVLGLALIALGLAVLGGSAGLVLAVVGPVLIGLGLAGRCPLELFVRRQPRTS